ncbi:MAG: FAD-binding protein, partial [Candidatus Paceibacterota bacterium]
FFPYQKKRSLSVTVLGGGSNVLISDDGLKGLVIKNEIGGISYVEKEEEVVVTSGAGVWWDDLVQETVAKGLWGMENLSAIPGTVGASPIQNVGAYGVEVSELITEVRVYDMLKDLFIPMTPKECQFGYRDSIFKTEEGKRFVVVGVTYNLSKVAKPRLEYKDLMERFGGGGGGGG